MSKGFTLFGRIVAKKGAAVKSSLFKGKKEKKERIDQDFPLGIHIGSKLSISLASLILHRKNMLLGNIPKELCVLAIGRFTLEGLQGYRFYLGEIEEPQAVLQIMAAGEDIEECRLFTSYDEVCPPALEGSEFWAEWLDEGTGIIGDIGFNIHVDEDVTISYGRAMGDDQDQWVPPVEVTETIISDPYGDDQTTVNLSYMTYGRWVDEEETTAEIVLVCAEEREDDALIHIMAGAELDVSAITVRY